MSKKEQREIARDSISDLLADNDIDINEDIDASTLTFEKTPSTVTRNNVETLAKTKEKAEKIMTSLLRVYLSEGFISKSEYVQAKVNFDAMTLGKIMNQMEMSETAITVLMDNIVMGDVNPKLFDALGNLQRTFIDLVKTQTNYVMNAEEEYRKLALEKDMVAEDSSSSRADEVTSGYKSSSQKQLMQIIRSTIDGGEK